MIHVKRVREAPHPADGVRILVDGLWPRGVKKQDLRLDGWVKTAAPSAELRRWFSHDPERWDEFRHRYFGELDSRPESWQPLIEAAGAPALTLLFDARDTRHNNAVALREYILGKLE